MASADRRRTQPIMRWWCREHCTDPLCDNYRSCNCSRWPAPAPAPEPEGDWWDPDDEGLCVWAAYQPKGAADLASSYLDLSGNGNNCGPGVAPTWDAVNGWIFNGTTQYLTTTFVPQNDQSQSMIIQYTNNSWWGKHLCGMWEADDRRFNIEPFVGGIAWRNGNSANDGVAAATGGNNCVAGNKGYVNGADMGVAIGAWAGAVTQAVYIGCQNRAGVPNDLAAVYVQAFALYDCTLTPAQVAAVAAAMAAL